MTTGYFDITTSGNAVHDITNTLEYDLSLGPASLWSNIASDGGDIRISVGGIPLARELGQDFSYTNHSGTLYFSTSGLLNVGSSTVFRITAGTVDTEPDPADVIGKYNVWSGDYRAVYHMDEPPSPLGMIDFTSYGSYLGYLPQYNVSFSGYSADLDGTFRTKNNGSYWTFTDSVHSVVLQFDEMGNQTTVYHENTNIFDNTQNYDSYMFSDGFASGVTYLSGKIKVVPIFNVPVGIHNSCGDLSSGIVIYPNITDGKMGRGLQFSGGVDYVFVEQSTWLQPANVTVECWAKPESSQDSFSTLFIKGFNPHAIPYTSYKISTSFVGTQSFESAINSTQPVIVNAGSSAADVWHKYVGTFSSTDGQCLYIDGVLIASGGGSIGQTIYYGGTAGAFMIGGRYANESFFGIIDEVRIASRPKSSGEIATEYYNQLDMSNFWTTGAWTTDGGGGEDVTFFPVLFWS